jgi:uncharacterized protein (TIGR02466 family)
MAQEKNRKITVSKIPLQETRLFYWRYPQWEKLNKKLLPEILKHQEESPEPLQGTNTLCWRGRKEYKCQSDLFKPISDVIACWLENYFPNKLFDVNINYWTNINKPGSSNMIHNHVMASCHLSGIYYVQAQNTGAIRFYTHEQMYNLIPDGMPYQRKIGHAPSDGDVLLWPSYLHHDVEPNLSAQNRINIAFNATVKPRKNVIKLEAARNERQH